MKPMEAEPIDRLPMGDQWLYEPKYDGFRCLVFRDGDAIDLESKNERPLNRYFPELASALSRLRPSRFVLDGEIVIPSEPFETLQLRLHPAQSRAATLATKYPAQLIAFDLLADEDGSIASEPFETRRAALEVFMRKVGKNPAITLSDATRSAEAAERWIGQRGLDGIMAKRLDIPYRPGERANRKYKVWKSVDAVLAGMYLDPVTGQIDSLLFGLYDEAGKLNFVGHVRVTKEATEMRAALLEIEGEGGFTGRSPAVMNRWSRTKRRFEPVKPVLVAELSADHISGGYMRHGARLVRWRTDKDPGDCTMDQIAATQQKIE